MELIPGQKVDVFLKGKPVNGNPMVVLKTKDYVLSKDWKIAALRDKEYGKRTFRHGRYTIKPHFEKFIILKTKQPTKKFIIL